MSAQPIPALDVQDLIDQVEAHLSAIRTAIGDRAAALDSGAFQGDCGEGYGTEGSGASGDDGDVSTAGGCGVNNLSTAIFQRSSFVLPTSPPPLSGSPSRTGETWPPTAAPTASPSFNCSTSGALAALDLGTVLSRGRRGGVEREGREGERDI